VVPSGEVFVAGGCVYLPGGEDVVARGNEKQVPPSG
jgi:hypothetical protein